MMGTYYAFQQVVTHLQKVVRTASLFFGHASAGIWV